MPRNHGGLFFSRGETPADPSPLFFSGGCNGRGEWQLSRGTSGFTALVSFAGAAWCRIRLTSMHLTSAGTGRERQMNAVFSVLIGLAFLEKLRFNELMDRLDQDEKLHALRLPGSQTRVKCHSHLETSSAVDSPAYRAYASLR